MTSVIREMPVVTLTLTEHLIPVETSRQRADEPLREAVRETSRTGRGGETMSDVNQAAANRTILNTQRVDLDFFLIRVKAFEQKYDKEWQQFLGEFNAGHLDKRNRDFVEWAFLCRSFSVELIQLEAKGPPGEASVFPEKPETTSGFCFAQTTHVRCDRPFRRGRSTSQLRLPHSR